MHERSLGKESQQDGVHTMGRREVSMVQPLSKILQSQPMHCGVTILINCWAQTERFSKRIDEVVRLCHSDGFGQDSQSGWQGGRTRVWWVEWKWEWE